MTVEKTLGGLLIALVLIMAAAGFALTPRWQVSQQVIVTAAPGPVLAYLGDLHHWPQWSTWNTKRYPGTHFSYAGANSGKGAKMIWNDGTNRTVWHITQYRPGRELDYQRRTGDGNIHYGRVTASGNHGKTHLQWQTWGTTGINPFARVMAEFLLPGIRKKMKQGFAGIRRHFSQPSSAKRQVGNGQ